MAIAEKKERTNATWKEAQMMEKKWKEQMKVGGKHES